MSHPKDALAQAARHVRQAEGHVAHQIALIEVLDRDQHPQAADMARVVLVTLRHSLELAREHLRLEREARGLDPEPPATE